MAGERPHNWDERSLFQHKHQIPSIKIDQAGWDKRWERKLRKLSASKDVFPMFSPLWRGHRFRGHRVEFRGMSDDLLRRIQMVLLRFSKEWEESAGCVIAWLLLDEAERKRHLFHGMMEACRQDSLHCDGRALCPEITTTAMLRQNGKAFTDFTRAYMKGIKEAGAGNVYLLPSEWWSSAVNMATPWPQDVKFAFTQLSLQRNAFISHFLAYTTLSIFDDLRAGNHGMEKIRKILVADSTTALVVAETRSSMRDKPLIRCQNCTKLPEEIEGNPKFMVCGICKSELHFIVHYCSRTCQKEDWSEHKKHCGKDKIVKKLPGTIHDSYWECPAMPNSDFYRSLFESATDGTVPVTSLGFGTLDPSHEHSPAFQLQVALLERDRDTEYFLFDDANRPVRFVLSDIHLKMSFRMLRTEAMFGPRPLGAEFMAEYLVKMMGGSPGLSRAGILAQFEKEYGWDMAARVATLEALGLRNRNQPGRTFFEVKCASMRMLSRAESS